MWHHTHMMDSMSGTHLVPPSYALPAENSPVPYAPEVRGWLQEYERRFGPRGVSSLTTDKVPLEWTCGPARVIDVRSLVGSTEERAWPISPEITVEFIQAAEKEHGELKPGDVVIFQTGHVDRHLLPQPAAEGLWRKPLDGTAEGWPAPGLILCVKYDPCSVSGVL